MIPVDAFTWTAAALPVALLLLLLVVWKRPAVEASALGVLAAVGMAWLVFKAPLSMLDGGIAKGLWNSVSIIAVIFPSIMIFEVGRAVGGFEAIRRDIGRLIGDELLQVLALGWCFTSFLQGPSGFGVPIAVAAPLLIGIGVRPLWAVLIPLMTHAWANTFGTLALAWFALLQQVDLASADVAAAAWYSGIFLWLLNIIGGLGVCWFYRRLDGIRRGLPAVAIISLIHGLGQLMLSQLQPTLSAFIPAIVALAATPLIARLPYYAESRPRISSPIMAERSPLPDGVVKINMLQAFLPYIFLMVVSVAVLLTPPLSSYLGSYKTSFSFPATRSGYGFIDPLAERYGPIAWLTHSGFFLLLSVLAAGGFFAARGLLGWREARGIVVNTLAKSFPASLSVAFLLAMSKVMGGSGQIDVLAKGTAIAFGGMYGFIAPLVGVLGAFMSSSNVSSNVLFCQFQVEMARLTGLSEVVVLAAQTSGGAIGTMFSPSKVLLGTITAGIIGQEGDIIRKLLPVSLIASLLMGILVMILG